MKRVVMYLTLALLGYSLPGQVNKFGVPIIRNYPTQITQGSEQNWCITKDNSGNLYFGNQDRGVIRYDGTRWSTIEINRNPRIYSLEADERGIIYVGAAFEFGYIEPGEKGKSEYISLSSRLDSLNDVKVITSIVVDDDKVFFLSPKAIFTYSVSDDLLSVISLRKFNLPDAFRLIKVNNRMILADNIMGLFELNDSIITPLPNGDYFKKKPCTVILPFENNRILIGTFFDGLVLYDIETGAVRSNFISEKLNQVLREVNVYSGAQVSSDLFAIGTTNQEGILFINRAGKLVQQIRKENSELEDNTILSLYCDYNKNSELWISTQGFISKAYVNIPITGFAEEQGIESGVNNICKFHDAIFVSSDAGILMSYTDKDNFTAFKKVPGINTQVRPIMVVKSPSDDMLLAGSLNGIIQISSNLTIKQVEEHCFNVPGYHSDTYNAKLFLQSTIDPSIIYIGMEIGGIVILKYRDGNWYFVGDVRNTLGTVYGIVEKKEGGLWFITDDPSSLFSLDIVQKDTIMTKYGPDKGVPDVGLNSIDIINDELYISSSSGILKYDKAGDKFLYDNNLTGGFSEKKYSDNLYVDDEGDLWYSGFDKTTLEILFREKEGLPNGYSGVLKLLPNVPLMDIIYSDGKAYILKSKMVYVADKASLQNDSLVVNTCFAKITVGKDSVVMEGTFYKRDTKNRRIPSLASTSATIPSYSYDMNEITFEWTTPYYTEEFLTEYSYLLEGFEKNWSKWEGISFGNTMEAQYPKREYTNLPYGHYTFRVRTRTLTGSTGNELSYDFVILKPWYATIFAFFGFALAAFLVIYAIIKAYTKKLKNENIRLEGIVAERTAVVVKQKDELESSIHYASRIQMALLPSEAILSENIKNYFVLFKPRDIVSGDFYWMTKKADRLYVVAADCTGHGVPGAFMSLLGMSFLDEIIDKDFAPRADTILNELRLHVTESLKQVGGDDEAKDGMDIALLVIDFNNQKVEFSGAYNPCFRVRKLTASEIKNYKDDSSEIADGSMSNGKYLLETINASKMPIGISSRMDEDFVFYNWALDKGISYYLFSDGYLDQFGGPNGRKFMKKNFKRLILDIQDYPMSRQKDILDDKLKEWMGHSPQIDDILVMGIRTD